MSSEQPDILITGATGFLGGRLSEILLDQGRPLRLLVRNPDKLPARLRDNCELIVGSLTDEQALRRAVNGVRWIYNCAANVNTWDQPEAYRSANVTGVEMLLAAIDTEAPPLERLLQVSTVDVYGFPDEPCDEEDAPQPPGFGYGDTKLAGEILVREWSQRSGIPCTVIRPANIFGPRGQFIERMGEELNGGLMVTIDHGRANAGLVYVDNLVRYMIWAAEAERAIGQIYNVRDDYDISWHDFVHRLRQDIGGRGRLLNLPYGLAAGVARALGGLYRTLGLRSEPLLHPLIIRILGKTCGHSAAKIRTHSQLDGMVDFDAAMRRSVEWFLSQAR